MAEQKKPARRAAGVLLHPSSLPGPYGIGDLGPPAFSWIDALVHARQKWWQILPLGPTGFGDSPYQSYSAFAGNTLLISPQFLIQDGILNHGDLEGVRFGPGNVDYGAVTQFKNRMLARAWELFQAGRGSGLRPAFEEYCRQQASWLDDYAAVHGHQRLAEAAKAGSNGRPNCGAARPARSPAPVKNWASPSPPTSFASSFFIGNGRASRTFARERGISIIGDIPIFVSGDSADVWANPHLFMLDGDCQPTVVAGVPPDYFSATGQLWGNPLYNWDALSASGFAWWVARLRNTLSQVDIIRLDHFRGFEAYWEIPAGNATAQEGRWVQAPGPALLETLQQALGGLPLIAEDLGLITPEVEALRDHFGLPGMRILQFAFGGGADNPYLPHMYVPNTVAYTGTHDNDTTRGWFNTTPEKDRDHVRRYLARDGSDIAWDFIRAAWSSVADLADRSAPRCPQPGHARPHEFAGPRQR